MLTAYGCNAGIPACEFMVFMDIGAEVMTAGIPLLLNSSPEEVAMNNCCCCCGWAVYCGCSVWLENGLAAKVAFEVAVLMRRLAGALSWGIDWNFMSAPFKK